jgi:hypothetical protein
VLEYGELVDFESAGDRICSDGIEVKVRLEYTPDELVRAIRSSAGKSGPLLPRPRYMVGSEFNATSVSE